MDDGDAARHGDVNVTPEILCEIGGGDGVPDAQEVGDVDLVTPPVNTDNNGLPDYLDDDSDDDGVLDGSINVPSYD